MANSFSVKCKPTQVVLNKAEKVLAANPRPKIIKLHGHMYRVLAVNPWFRLLDKNDGKGWVLFSHEKYTKEIAK